MTIRKTIWLVALAIVPLFSVHAQHFDWAKGFNGLVVGSVADADGNLYILSRFGINSTWDGERILPMVPYGHGPNSINTLIAKISPSGEMLWKKVIHANNNSNTIPYDIKLMGDTAFACLVNVPLPTVGNYCYFLDTLLPTWSDYPIPLTAETTSCATFTAYLVFDFTGEVLEQHFIQVSYIDTTGNDFQPFNLGIIDSYPLQNPSFDINANGNIYICRQAEDYHDDVISVEEGSAIGLRFWVDRQCVGTVYVNDGHHPRWVPQLLKFSPHLASLLDSRYVFESNNGTQYDGALTYLKLNSDGQPFVVGNLYMAGGHCDTLTIDSAQEMAFSHSNVNDEWGYMVSFDDNLTPRYYVALKDSVVGDIPLTTSRSVFHDVAFDSDSNRVFVSVAVGKNEDATSKYAYGNLLLPLERNDAFVLSLDMNTGDYRSCAVVPSLTASDLGILESRGNLLCRGNRILMQIRYLGGVQFPNRTIHAPGYNPGWCLMMFDYSGRIIDGIDYNSFSSQNRTGPLVMADSVLYLMNQLRTVATFGDIFVPEQGEFACIARYVDTAFMTPYVYTGDTGDVRITVVGDEGAFVAYPNPFRQRVTIECSENLAETARLTDLTGRREQVRLTAEGIGRYSLDLTSHPQATYLLTLTTASGKTHTVRLLKQSDIFSR